MKLYVWEGFCPDYTDGLAVAIASDESQARQMILENNSGSVYQWGILSIHELDKPISFDVWGGA